MSVARACAVCDARAAVGELVPRPRAPVVVAASECLLGARVRYDGASRRAALPHDALAGVFRLRGICPEVEIGLGVPREPIQLVASNAREPVRARGVRTTARDVTDDLRAFAACASETLADANGYIFMEGSPSCGLFQVKVHARAGDAAPRRVGRGIYSAEIARRLPALPLCESRQLFEPTLRENFIARAFAHAHWRAQCAAGLCAHTLRAFHRAYEARLRAHSAPACARLAKLLARAEGFAAPVARAYFPAFMRALARG